VGNSAKHLLQVAERWALPAVVTTTVLAIAVVAFRWWLESRALADRASFELVPSESFDPSSEGLSAFGKQLSRLRPAVSLVPRRGLPLRVSVAAGPDGVLHHRITVPAGAVSVLRSACPPDIELRAPDYDQEPTMAAWREQHGLTRPPVETTDPDASTAVGDAGAQASFDGGDGGDGGDGAAGSAGSAGEGEPGEDGRPSDAAAADSGPRPAGSPPHDAVGEENRPPEYTVRAELILARDSKLPLATPGLDPDPLSAFASAAAAINEATGGTIEVHLDLLPLTAARARALRRGRSPFGRDRGQSGFDSASMGWSRKLTNPSWWASWVEPRKAISEARTARSAQTMPGGRPTAQSRAAGMEGLLEDRARAKAVAAKLTSRDQTWMAQVLLRSTSGHPDVSKMQLRSLLSAFDQWSGDNYWRTAGLNLGPLQLSSADRWWRRWRFDRRIARGLFRPAGRSWVTTTEIAGLLKPPTARCGAANVTRSLGSIQPPPRNLPVYAGVGDARLLPLGWVRDPAGGWRPAGVPKDLTLFELNLGQSGSGKSTRVEAQFIHLALSGEGGMYLDPHALSLERIKPYLGPVADRILEINLSGRGTNLRQAGWNLLSMEGRGPADVEYRVAAVVDSFASALNWTDQNNRAKTLTQMSAQALCELNLQLPPHRQATIFQMSTILADKEWREAVLPYLSQHTQDFYVHRFDKLAAEAITPVTNLLDRLRASSAIAALFGSPRSTYDARRAMDSGQIVLACTSGTGDKDRLINCFFLYDVMQAALSRITMPEAARKLFWLCGDELQEIDRAGIVARMLEQLRKFGLRMAGATQALSRLPDATVTSWMTNWSALIAGNVDDKVARMLTAAWDTGQSDRLKPATLKALPAWHALASATLPAASKSEAPKRSTPFLTRTFRLDDLYAEQHDPAATEAISAAVDVNLARRPIAETLADLDHLDEDIIAALASRAGHRPDPTPTPPLSPTSTNGQRRPTDASASSASAPEVPDQTQPTTAARRPARTSRPLTKPENVVVLHAGRKRRRPATSGTSPRATNPSVPPAAESPSEPADTSPTPRRTRRPTRTD
jgi:hypothetical protein